jgi:hypothetical protein
LGRGVEKEPGEDRGIHHIRFVLKIQVGDLQPVQRRLVENVAHDIEKGLPAPEVRVL